MENFVSSQKRKIWEGYDPLGKQKFLQTNEIGALKSDVFEPLKSDVCFFFGIATGHVSYL